MVLDIFKCMQGGLVIAWLELGKMGIFIIGHFFNQMGKMNTSQ